jgi:periplasmic divalent cation tolerance protein
MTNLVLVLTTVSADRPVDDVDSADRIARLLVAERLAACVNIGAPMTSVYRWQGTVTRDAERQLLIKTTADRVAAVKARLLELHPYELPEIVVIPVVDSSALYLEWVQAATATEGTEG